MPKESDIPSIKNSCDALDYLMTKDFCELNIGENENNLLVPKMANNTEPCVDFINMFTSP